MKETRDRIIENRAPKKGTNMKLSFKPTTAAALRKRGINDANDCRLVTDKVLDGVIEELMMNNTPPMPLAWVSALSSSSTLSPFSLTFVCRSFNIFFSFFYFYFSSFSSSSLFLFFEGGCRHP